MKHFSRLLALLLAVALLPLSFMAAASAEEPVTITIWGSDRENMPFRNGLWTIDKLQEKLGIKIEIISAPTENLAEKFGLLIAGGDFPTIVQYKAKDLLLYKDAWTPLNDLINETDTPNLWKVYSDDEIRRKVSDADGVMRFIGQRTAITAGKLYFWRQDWLDKLGLEAPTTKEEFYNMLCAFRDNAETLLGDDADKMIPFSVSYDVGWRASTLIESFLDPEMSDKEFYVNGFDDRKLTENGVRDAIELLNTWYNEGLMWKDFALYTAGDTTEDDMMKAGYVGAFIHNWDYPYRNGADSIQANLQRLVGEDAAYVAIDPFEDKNGTHTKWIAGPIDRKVFFPITNQEPLACLLYLDWLSVPEHLEYLQIGDEGVTHEKLESGAVKIIAATGDAIQNSGFNIDYTLTCNGLHLVDDEQTALSIAYNYAEVDPELVEIANAVAKVDTREGKNANCGTIDAENGMTETLNSKRDILLDTSVSAAPDAFAATYDNAMADYLGSGGQAIMDERAQKWEATYGDTDMLP